MFIPPRPFVSGTLSATFLILLPLLVFAQSGAPATPSFTEPRMDQSETMVNEPILFRRDTADTAPAGRLLYPPESIVSVQDFTLQTTYEEGRDYVWNAGTRTLTLPEGSRIPFREEAAFYPAPDAPEAIAAAVGAHQGDWLLFGEGGNVFCDFQVAVTYRHTSSLSELKNQENHRPLGIIANFLQKF